MQVRVAAAQAAAVGISTTSGTQSDSPVLPPVPPSGPSETALPSEYFSDAQAPTESAGMERNAHRQRASSIAPPPAVPAIEPRASGVPQSKQTSAASLQGSS